MDTVDRLARLVECGRLSDHGAAELAEARRVGYISALFFEQELSRLEQN